jgi:hypothetical protein
MAMTKLAAHAIPYPAPDYLLAEVARVSAPIFSLMQQGKRPVTGAVAMRLSALFHCLPQDLMGWATEGTDIIILEGERCE